MILIKTTIKDGPKLLKSNVYNDNRGFLRETFSEKILKKKFPFDIMSYSRKNVVRGLHIQLKNPQAKLITVTHGKIFDVAVDLRKNSKTFGKIFKTILSEKNSKSIYIPPGFLHAFLTLDTENIVVYGCTKYRNKDSEIGVLWNDNDLKVNWPTKNPLISNKDKKNMSFKDFIKLK